jgi:hypothetical protein
VVTVVGETGGGGSAGAAPIAFEVLRAWWRDRQASNRGVVGEGGPG